MLRYVYMESAVISGVISVHLQGKANRNMDYVTDFSLQEQGFLATET